MQLSSKALLARLGAGEPIADVCRAAGITAAEFDAWWRRESASRAAATSGPRRGGVSASVDIARDRFGIPHIFAANDRDLFFGFGYAMAQDRLFQLDYLRRKGAGRLAEVLGAEAMELDLLARTVGLKRIAQVEMTKIPTETRAVLEAFSAGVNAHLDDVRSRLPIEFDLLEYQPEPWSPLDCLVIEGEFRWYLTGRFPVIVMPELAKRALGEGPLYRAFLERESDEESMIPPGSYPAGRSGSQPIGTAAGDPAAGEGSNNWVLAGRRTNTGRPIVASDPHIAIDAVSCWYQVHLCGGSYNVAGMAYAGIPAVMFGRTERVAWGCTNNICSQRDLYQERTDPAHPGCYRHGDKWIAERRLTETIQVKGAAAVAKTIRFSPNGPIVDDVLPVAARKTGPVALKWLGAYEGGWLTALLAMDKATSADEFREATRPWHVPTFSVVFADVEGHIGYQSTGRIPIRKHWERGYRPGWDPDHQWDGLIPFEGMPRLADPERGWIATANHRPAPDDFPYPLSGTWSDDFRARRIRQMIEERPRLSVEHCGRIHQDALSLRAARSVLDLLRAIERAAEPRFAEAAKHLATWDCRMEPDRVGATIFDVFWVHWTQAVARQRFEGETAELLIGGINGLAASLIEEDPSGWFDAGGRLEAGGRREAILGALSAALRFLTERLGAEMTSWTWGRLHTLPLLHVLSGRGELAKLLNHGGAPVKGNMLTVCNTGTAPDYTAKTGAGYRLIADLAASPPRLWAIDAPSQSGQPGSLHYSDQFDDWLAGRYHDLPLDRETALANTETRMRLDP